MYNIYITIARVKVNKFLCNKFISNKVVTKSVVASERLVGAAHAPTVRGL